MAETGRCRPHGVRDDPEDPGASEASHRQDGGSRGEGPARAREGEAVQGAQGDPVAATRAGGGGAGERVPASAAGEDAADEGDGERAEHVPGSDERVQVRSR